MINWKDATNYSRGERGLKAPTAWEANVSGLRIWVSRGHVHHPDNWIMNAHGLEIKEMVIGPSHALTDEEVQSEAIRMCWDEARQIIAVVTEQKDALFAEIEVQS